MGIVIDRRSEPSKGRGSRERLVQRTREAARQAINKSIREGNITDIGKKGADVTVPKGGLSEPQIRHGEGGIYERVLPGNNNEKARFRAGDKLPRPEGGGGGGGGREASEDGEGEDSFVYHLSEKEFLDLLFDDLELPNMYKFGAEDEQKTTIEHAGYSATGTFNRLSLIRSKMEKSKREVIMNRHTNERIIELLEEQKNIFNLIDGKTPSEGTRTVFDESLSKKAIIRNLEGEVQCLRDRNYDYLGPAQKERIASIDEELGELNAQKKLVAKWRERPDLRFRAVEEEPLPASKAVMFCEMDVSGSMDEDMKSNAKLFFFLLYRFLQRQYDQVNIVFIRHHSVADEVDEKEFFQGRVTGGTVVSTAHEKLLEIQSKRYPEKEWNIYGAQASDGDNASNDEQKTLMLMKKILPVMQGFFHIEVGDPNSMMTKETDLWRTYKPLAEQFKDRFWMERVKERKDVWPVFRELFKKRSPSTPQLQSRSTAFNLSQG